MAASNQPVGMDHPTIVPANFEPAAEPGDDEESITADE